MKYLKLFENMKNPQVGDYVICYEDIEFEEYIEYYNFINNTIGKIIEINDDEEVRGLKQNLPFRPIDPIFTTNPYHIQYDNIPWRIEDFFSEKKYKNISRNDIFEFDKNIETLKLKITAKKYNL